MKKYGKKLREATKDLDLKKEYSIEEAIELVKKADIASFDSTIEVHAKLALDLSKPEQNVRSTVVLPKGTGKKVRVLAFVGDKNEKIAKDAGADFIGLDELVEKILKGWTDFDIAVATPETMPKIAKVAKVLGSRGLMPNPKAGTVTQDIAKTIEEFKKGKVEFRSDSLGGIHIGIGKKSFSNEDLVENFNTLQKALITAKPSAIKGSYIKTMTISSTMGPGIKLKI